MSTTANALLAEALKATRFGLYCQQRLAEGGPLAATRALVDLQTDTFKALLGVARGERDGLDAAAELGSRSRAGLRYEALVQTWGRELFGSARPGGEALLAEDEHYRLVHIPAMKGAARQPALFHLGGVLPYGDRVFRLLPEACFYERFTERGMPVYALELKGDAGELDYRDLTIEKVIDAVSHFSGLALDHAGGRRMILEGYCGLAAQALAYAMARPAEADARFRVVATFVGPVDGTRCQGLAEVMQVIPASLREGAYQIAELSGAYLSGDQLRSTQDLALNAFFGKTPMGRFAWGWKRPEYASVDSIESLTPEMRKDLAGAYWISPENCRRWPVPVGLGRFSEALFTRGVDDFGSFGTGYHGRPLRIGDAAQGTRLQFVGFYGGKDSLVPQSTAEPLQKILGSRYTHVVHPAAGHVSYLFTPSAWESHDVRALLPNPVDVLLEASSRAGARADKD